MDKKRSLTFSKAYFDMACECLDDSKAAFAQHRLKNSLNRSYYAIFNMLRAVVAIEGFSSKKHSGVISHFNYTYLRTKIFDPEISALITSAFETRSDADYGAMYEANFEETQEQISNAEYIVSVIEPYLKLCWTEMEDKQ